MITEASLERQLEQLGREYRAIRYRGPALRNLPAAPPRAEAGAWAWAWAGAIGGVFAAVLWLWLPEPQFGADARLAPSPYAALKQVRQSLPVSPATLTQPKRQALILPISPPALPPLPPRRSGFAQTTPSQALHRPLPARFGQA